MIVHGLVVHSAQPGECGVQLTEEVMSLGPLGWSHWRRTVLHDSAFATTLAGVPSPIESRNHDTIGKSSVQTYQHAVHCHTYNCTDA